jgi:lipoprotein NlpD
MTRLYLIVLSLLSITLAGCFSQQPAPVGERGSPTAQARTQPGGPGYYTVKRGDTLYAIAREHGLTYRDIAAWNYITNPDSISEGQILRVIPPATDGGGAVVTTPVGSGGGVETRSLDSPPAAAAADDGLKREPRVGKEAYSDAAYARLSAGAMPQAAETKSEPANAQNSAPTPAPAAGPDDVPWLWPSAGKVIAPFNDPANKGIDFAGKIGDPVLAAGEGKVVHVGSALRGYGELIIVKHNATFISAYAHNSKILVKQGQQVARGQKIAEMGNTDADTVKLHFEIRKQGKPVDPAQYLPKR